MSLEYSTLEKTSVREVHQCFLDAFSDYIVDIRMPEAAFREMNELRAVDFCISIGAFDRGRMVGLTLNAADRWNGKRTAYDAGTGVIPAFRGRGISKAIMQKGFEILQTQGFESYLLEVITSNEKALKLYQNLGFRITRKLDCLVLKNPGKFLKAKAPFPIVDVPREKMPLLQKAWAEEQDLGFQPSWQNSWNTINRRPDLHRLVACFDQERCLGYGVIAAGRGGIAQLWVKNEARRQGLGSRLLQELMARSPLQKAYSWVNVDAGATHTLDFLKTIGFTEQLAQYEMLRDF